MARYFESPRYGLPPSACGSQSAGASSRRLASDGSDKYRTADLVASGNTQSEQNVRPEQRTQNYDIAGLAGQYRTAHLAPVA